MSRAGAAEVTDCYLAALRPSAQPAARLRLSAGSGALSAGERLAVVDAASVRARLDL